MDLVDLLVEPGLVGHDVTVDQGALGDRARIVQHPDVSALHEHQPSVRSVFEDFDAEAHRRGDAVIDLGVSDGTGVLFEIRRHLRLVLSVDERARGKPTEVTLRLDGDAVVLDGALNAYQQATTLLTEAGAEAEQARRLAARATPEPAPAATPAPATPAPATPSPEEAILDTLARYERAIENEDLALFRSVKPNLTSAEEKRLKASFDAVDSHQVTLEIQQIRVAGTTAEVQINRRDTIEANGNSRDNQSRQTVVLERRGAGWVIVAFKR